MPTTSPSPPTTSNAPSAQSPKTPPYGSDGLAVEASTTHAEPASGLQSRGRLSLRCVIDGMPDLGAKPDDALGRVDDEADSAGDWACVPVGRPGTRSALRRQQATGQSPTNLTCTQLDRILDEISAAAATLGLCLISRDSRFADQRGIPGARSRIGTSGRSMRRPWAGLPLLALSSLVSRSATASRHIEPLAGQSASALLAGISRHGTTRVCACRKNRLCAAAGLSRGTQRSVQIGHSGRPRVGGVSGTPACLVGLSGRPGRRSELT